MSFGRVEIVGIYNARSHLLEVWRAVAPAWLRKDRGTRDLFDSESGLPLLERRFARVERGGSAAARSCGSRATTCRPTSTPTSRWSAQ